MSKMTMVQAINLALRQEMEKDDRVVLLGEDIGDEEEGGVDGHGDPADDAAQRGDLASAAAIVLLHLAGSLACTVLGIVTFNWLRAA